MMSRCRPSAAAWTSARGPYSPPAAMWSCTAMAGWTRCRRWRRQRHFFPARRAHAPRRRWRGAGPAKARRWHSCAPNILPCWRRWPEMGAAPGPLETVWEDAGRDPDALVEDVEGFEGPLDLLLHLARQQKVDLSRISILALTEQYLAFSEQARALKLEIAADYLVMAAWLAYLKSRLLILDKPDEQRSGEELAAVLQFRLRRLEAIRELGEKLVNRARLGRDFFAR